MSATFSWVPRAPLLGLACIVAIFGFPPALFAQSAADLVAGAMNDGRSATKPLGSIDYIRGNLALVRNGEAQADPGPGDPVYSGDLLRTDRSSTASIAMDPSSGFSGSFIISPGSVLYLDRAMAQDQPKTKLNLMAGSVSAKISKIAGSPGLDVATGSSDFGVRGTEFQVALSLNATLLALCIEGKVAVKGGGSVSALPAGQAVRQDSDGVFSSIGVDPSSIRDLRDRWMEGEGAAFRNAPLKALSIFEGIYSEHDKEIIDESRKLALDPIFRKWLQQHRLGVVPDAMNPQVLREKKDIAPKLISLAKRLAIFERVYWRLGAMVDIVRNGDFSRREIRKGLLVSQFVAIYDKEGPELEKAIFLYRAALGLYLERSPDSEDFVTTLLTGGSE